MVTSEQQAYRIHAEEEVADTSPRVLKQGDTFAVLDRYGDIQVSGLDEEGVYHEGTRHLSEMRLLLAGHRPLLMASTVVRDNSLLAVDLTNPDLRGDSCPQTARGMLHFAREAFLWGGAFYQRLKIANFCSETIEKDLILHLDADFADIFEVRGIHRERRGVRHAPETTAHGLRIAYDGLDGVQRITSVFCDPKPASVSTERGGGTMRFRLRLEPHQKTRLEFIIAFNTDERPPPYRDTFRKARQEYDRRSEDYTRIETSHQQFNEWLDRSLADLAMMATETPHGVYPYAGVPWFSTVFGRDGIITALQSLWVNPALARGVLGYLAVTQAAEHDPERGAQPGKILHELRTGEMAALGEIPFGRYYGTIDATPLFIVLAGEYQQRTGDLDYIQSIWPNIERALQWIDEHGDQDDDGFVEYTPDPHGLANQGWKDSDDSIFHADGSLAPGSIALCEVQGYVYAARRAAARLAMLLEREEQAEALLNAADAIRARFDQVFWDDELGIYVLALDGEKRPCRVRSSNAGHCLFTGIAYERRAGRVAAALMDEASFSGWGVRTIPANESRYNPMSYHNGSIWPHDTALVAAGLAHYGFRKDALRLMTGLFETSLHFDLARLPELFCGFTRHIDRGPTQYPLACAPQAWAAAASFLLLQVCLGLHLDAPERRLTLYRPVLPKYLKQVSLENLRLGETSLDLTLHRYPADVVVSVQRRDGPVEVAVVK